MAVTEARPTCWQLGWPMRVLPVDVGDQLLYLHMDQSLVKARLSGGVNLKVHNAQRSKAIQEKMQPGAVRSRN